MTDVNHLATDIAAPKPVADERLRDDTWWYGPVAIACFLAFWELAVRLGNIPEIFLPRPSLVVVALYDLFAHKQLLYDLFITLVRIFGGFFLAAIVGITLGLLMGMSRRIYAIADIFVAALYPVPKIALLPLLVIWLGTGNAFQIALSALGCIFPILINTIIGVKQCDEGLILAARDLGASKVQIQRKVVLPAAVPAIFGGLRLALGISIILVVAAEMQTARYGLGAKLQLAGQVLETGQVFAILLLLAIIGIALTKVQDRIGAVVDRWRAK
ncbi:ABC transporter permease [Bradyrhizobium sp. U87765 SZCCT0131]|uniref:ABC transporter permease n=1 Tax=unclassified Bradyrhizobium TaxID=2631580 RepID=UPI001BAA2C82|nr:MULTISPECIES: ABC transporter permease [unclassified Bradyrhizobium]MBR1222495.1 ABC transporter permease [Bradyrhizobium sp. U87765 SZCCT0131]MBR1265424.1 ABC transporter permease [Bradyrhizobium sp. U87765 SZCCT0134]MBR1302797.1 ABC transporter permease [Bradyrhizobium sp. U87765 SZCCT0110]MBR1323495.1 ABC transporter permease [Bradyrhizobium sp. U87765 SZCCT0109]MBR1346726.1 ABC transporter permease [Bradyrhizobium sp. U87765 SZCCT0048]